MNDERLHMVMLRKFSVRTFGMLLCAYVWTLVGVGALQDVSTPYPGVFHLMIPGEIRGAVWLGSAAAAVTTAWSRRLSSIALGFLWFMPFLQMLSYGSAWLLSRWPGGSPGFPLGWYSAALYLALIGMVILTALIPSTPPARPALRDTAPGAVTG